MRYKTKGIGISVLVLGAYRIHGHRRRRGRQSRAVLLALHLLS